MGAQRTNTPRSKEAYVVVCGLHSKAPHPDAMAAASFLPILLLRICELFEQLSSSSKSQERVRVIQVWVQKKHDAEIPRYGPGALAL